MSTAEKFLPHARVIALVVFATISLGGDITDAALTAGVVASTALLGASMMPRSLFQDAASAQWLFGPALATGVVAAAPIVYLLLVIADLPLIAVGAIQLAALPLGLLRLCRHGNWQHDGKASLFCLATTAVSLGLYSIPLLWCGAFGTCLLFLDRTSALAQPSTRKVRLRQLLFAALGALVATTLVFQRQSEIPLPDTWTLQGEAMALGLSDPSGRSWLYTPTLRYHWLGNLWLGSQIRLFDLEPLVGSVILIPVLAALAITSIMFAATSKVADASIALRWAAVISTTCAASVVEPLTLTVDRQASNVLGTLALILAVPVLAGAASASKPPRSAIALLGVLGFFLSATKAPLALVVGGGLTAMSVGALVGGLRRSMEPHAIRQLGLAAAVWGSGVVVGYLAISGGSASTGHVRLLSPVTGMQIFRPPSLGTWRFNVSASWIGATAIFASIALTRTPVLVFLFQRSRRTTRNVDLLPAFVLGALLAGTATTWTRFVGEQTLYFLSGSLAAAGVSAAIVLNSVPSAIHHQRARTVFGLIAFAAVLGIRLSVDLARMLDRLNLATTLWYLALVLVVLLTGTTLMAGARATSRYRGSSLGTRSFVIAGIGLALYVAPLLSGSLTGLGITRTSDGSPSDRDVIQDSVRDAADLVRAESDKESVIATNYVCTADACDLRPHLVGVISQRSLLWESAGETRAFPHFDPTSRVADARTRKQLNQLVTTRIGSTELEQLQRAGVGWVLIAPEVGDPHHGNACEQLPRMGDCVYSKDGVTVIRLSE